MKMFVAPPNARSSPAMEKGDNGTGIGAGGYQSAHKGIPPPRSRSSAASLGLKGSSLRSSRIGVCATSTLPYCLSHHASVGLYGSSPYGYTDDADWPRAAGAHSSTSSGTAPAKRHAKPERQGKLGLATVRPARIRSKNAATTNAQVTGHRSQGPIIKPVTCDL